MDTLKIAGIITALSTLSSAYLNWKKRMDSKKTIGFFLFKGIDKNQRGIIQMSIHARRVNGIYYRPAGIKHLFDKKQKAKYDYPHTERTDQRESVPEYRYEALFFNITLSNCHPDLPYRLFVLTDKGCATVRLKPYRVASAKREPSKSETD